MLSKAYRKLSYWRRSLGIEAQAVRIERISRMQVTDEEGKPGAGLVGIVVDTELNEAVIVTTRALRDDDVVHELTHLTNPELDHPQVDRETSRLLVMRNSIYHGNGVKEREY